VTPGLVGVASGLLGLVLLCAVLAVDRRARVRILPMAGTDLRGPSAQSYAAVLLLTAGAVIHTIYSPVLIQRIDGASPLVAGYVVACEAVGWSVVAMFVGGVAEQKQGRYIRLGAALVVLGLIGLVFLVGHAPLWAIAVSSAVMGSGFGLSFAFMTARAVYGLEGDERALASAAVPTVQTTGAAIGAALAGVMASLLGLGRPFDAATASAAALPLYAAFVPLALLGAFAAWWLGRERVNVAR
jgi:predicted MFS family arabinose efflux permease